MNSTWQTEAGRLALRWSDAGQRLPFDFSWAQDISATQTSYLPPNPDFCSHSPFGGASWYGPQTTSRNLESILAFALAS